ncbi:MAG: hypothetical protein V3S07_10505 [Micropepsaceae bacterium]
MKLAKSITACAVTAAAILGTHSFALAQSDPTYVRLESVNAARFVPDEGPAPHIAFVSAHRTGNTIGSSTCTELAQRGFMAICFETRFRNDDIGIQWEELPHDVKAVVDYARAQPGITRVVLLGHSGGSPMMSLYQAIAENGKSVCERPELFTTCADEDYGEMVPADGIVYPDAHPGNPVQALRSFNPSVTIKDGVRTVIPELDPYSPANGYNPHGSSTYSQEFIDRYYVAQSAKMNSLIEEVQHKQDLIARGEYAYNDDDLIVIPGGNAVIAHAAPELARKLTATRNPAKLMRDDGSYLIGIVTSVMVADEDLAAGGDSLDGADVHKLSTFMSSVAIRSGNALDDIDHCSTINSTICFVADITVPVVFLAMGGYKFIGDHEIMYENSASEDKDFVVIEGALHGYDACTRCETTPGQYANSTKNTFDYIRDWTNARF